MAREEARPISRARPHVLGHGMLSLLLDAGFVLVIHHRAARAPSSWLDDVSADIIVERKWARGQPKHVPRSHDRLINHVANRLL